MSSIAEAFFYAGARSLLVSLWRSGRRPWSRIHPFVATSLENYAALPRETEREDKVEEMEVRASAIQAKLAQQNPVQ